MQSNKYTCLLLLILVCGGCKKSEFFKPDDPQYDINTYISFTVNGSITVLADGQQTLPILCELKEADTTDFFTFNFPDTAGRLLLTTDVNKEFMEHDTATILFQASTYPGVYTFATQLDGRETTNHSFTITTQPSLPDTLLVDADKSIADTAAGSVVNFTVYLKRKIGYVSNHTPIDVTAYQVRGGTNVTVGRFTGLSTNGSDPTGKVQIQYFTDTGDLDRSQLITVVFSSPNNNNGTTTTVYSLKTK